MVNTWITGLKQYNSGKDKWCIPRKGSDDYNKIMGGIKQPKTKQATKEQPKTKQLTFKEIDERRTKEDKQRRAENAKLKRRAKSMYASRSKKKSSPIDFEKDRKETEEVIKKYDELNLKKNLVKNVVKKKSGVLL